MEVFQSARCGGGDRAARFAADPDGVVIWQFTRIGNDFLSGVIFAGADSRPITIALNNPVDTSERTKEYNVNMAAAIIAALRTLVFYIMTGRYFVRGLTAGAVKGDTLVFTQLNGNGSISRIHPDANPAPMSTMDLLFDVSKSLLFDHHVGGAHRLTRQTPCPG